MAKYYDARCFERENKILLWLIPLKMEMRSRIPFLWLLFRLEYHTGCHIYDYQSYGHKRSDVIHRSKHDFRTSPAQQHERYYAVAKRNVFECPHEWDYKKPNRRAQIIKGQPSELPYVVGKLEQENRTQLNCNGKILTKKS